MTEQELYNEYRKSDFKSFIDFLINKIAELKADNDARKYAMAMSEKVEKQLREENAKLKEKLKPENCLKLLAKDGYVKFTSDQLTKAKEIIKDLCVMVRELNKPNVQLTNVDYSLSEAEQFIKEIEKC